MKIAIASGKGGTGKTMVTASLTVSWGAPVVAVDLDVEEPNLHLFLKPELSGRQEAFMEVPLVDEQKCDYCRQCAEFCQFKAISVLPNVVMVFPEMCHGCGGCMALCPREAIATTTRTLGEIAWGRSADNAFIMGRLRVGEAMSPPLIRKVQACLSRTDLFDPAADVLMDAPPGVSCPAVNAVIDSDFILLVTEPTPFGVFDLRLAQEAFRPLHKPMGVVINRAGLGNGAVYDLCREVDLPILAEIPYDRDIAAVYADGRVVALSDPRWQDLFRTLARSIQAAVMNSREARHA
ncbi:4Fe-4S binding protein [Desulfatitalea alkaliphila]|uniref:ATP-binding protein n=1 Tax=Desulfatitalea alkaliphila TaxID=2929485 RepID=A0AA41R8C7_9BACT|nr:ATP-binding protein [Desulfatitalea alkaliphila]MCJ8502900.1 ATP-binding protein [Desulfatitalea alkaliphila]